MCVYTKEKGVSVYRLRVRTNKEMTNAKKIISVIVLTTIIVLGLFAAVYAAVKGFEPLMIPVDKENLPEQVSESDLEDGYISTHKLMGISRDTGEIIFLDSTNGRTYEARSNMVLSKETVVDTAEVLRVAVEEYMEKINSVDLSLYEGENLEKVEALIKEYSEKEFKAHDDVTKDIEKEESKFKEELAKIPTGPVVTAETEAVQVEQTSQTTQSQPVQSQTSQQTSQTTQQTPQSQPTQTSQPTQQTSAHEHTWVEITKTVYHEAEGHYESVVIQAAWDEEITEIDPSGVMTDCVWRTGGGIYFYGWTQDECEAQYNEWLYSLGEASKTTPTNYSSYCENYPTITTTIHHDAVTETRWVEDRPAWTEDVVTGHRCTSCGATK